MGIEGCLDLTLGTPAGARGLGRGVGRAIVGLFRAPPKSSATRTNAAPPHT